MNSRFVPVFGAILLVIALFSDALCSEKEFGKISPVDWFRRAPEKFPDANVIAIFSIARVALRKDWKGSKSEWYFHKRIKILTPSGADEVGEIDIPYHMKDKIESFRAHTVFRDGTILEVAEDDLFEKEINDFRYKSFAFPSVDSGCIIEYEYTLISDKYKYRYDWNFSLDIFSFESVFTIALGGFNDYNAAFSNIPVVAQTPRRAEMDFGEDETLKTFTWKLRNLDPARSEPYMASIENYTPSLHIWLSNLQYWWMKVDLDSSWPTIGKNFDYGMKSFMKRPLEAKHAVRKVTKGVKSKYDKARLIYSMVTDSIKTIVGDYGLARDHKNLGGVWEDKYGSPFEKNMLLVSLFRAARIKAWPILICTRDQATFNPNWKNVSQFSHTIVFAEMEQGGIYLDASLKNCPFGTLPPDSRTDVGLLLDEEKSQLVKITTNDPRSYRLDITKIKLDDQLSVICSTESVSSGYLAIKYGTNSNSYEPEEFVSDFILASAVNKDQISDLSCNLDSTNRFRVKVNYNSDDFTEEVGENLFVRLPVFMFSSNPFKSNKRVFPIDFMYAFTHQNIVKMELPSAECKVILPSDTSVAADGLYFSRQCSVIESQVTIQTIIKVERPLFEVYEYPVVKEFFDIVAECNDEVLILTSGWN